MSNPPILLVVCIVAHIAVHTVVGEPNELSVHIEAFQSALVLGEPLFITARVRNDSKVDVAVFRQNSPSYELRSVNPFVVMISEDGIKYERWSDSFRTRYKSSPIELAPEAELAADLVIMFSGRHGLAFKQPGEYWISVKVIATDMESFQAEPIRVTVMLPGRDSAEAWNVLRSAELRKKYGELIQTPWQAHLDANDVEQCDDIIQLYPNSVYVEYLALSLGRWYLEGPQADKSQARRYLQIAKSTASTDFLSARAKKLLAREKTPDNRASR